MTGMHITLRDGVPAFVEELQILSTYDGQLAGTLTVGTRHRLPAYEGMMEEARTGRRTGFYCLPPELVDEVELRGFSTKEAERIRGHTDLGKCLKELHLIADIHIHDSDQCHIIQIHWFQTGRELSEAPLSELIQKAVGSYSFAELHPYCEHVDWLDMY